MKNKILSYVLWWFLAVLLGLWWLSWNQVKADTCGDSELPVWYICCGDYSVSEGIGCDRVAVVTWCKWWCCWIKLNTNFPIIWNCIEIDSATENPTNAFPYMIWALTKIIISLILVVCFILVIVAWIMRAGDKPKEGKELLKKVAITILLLWFSWVILRLINPNFFG